MPDNACPDNELTNENEYCLMNNVHPIFSRRQRYGENEPDLWARDGVMFCNHHWAALGTNCNDIL